MRFQGIDARAQGRDDFDQVLQQGGYAEVV